MNKVEENHKKQFRDKALSISDQVRPRIEVIKKAKSKDANKNGLYNIGTIYNNKMSEILHYYYKRNLPFFDESIISNSIDEYLDFNMKKGVGILNAYMNKCVYVADVYAVIANNDQELLDSYKDVTELIYDFDIKKDILDAVQFLLNTNIEKDPNFRYAYLRYYKEIVREAKTIMEKLDLEDRIVTVEDELQAGTAKCLSLVYKSNQ